MDRLRIKAEFARAAKAALFLLPVFLASCETAPPDEPELQSEPNYTTVTVRAGDSVSKIAADYSVSTETVQRLNGLSPDDTIYPGEELRLPERSHAARTAVLEQALRVTPRRTIRRPAIAVHELRPPRLKSHRLPDVVPHPRSDPEFAEAEPAGFSAPSPSSVAFEWPVEGRIVAAFGVGENGERNDGINIAADRGTPIHAAASGTVTYADRLKGYGNLILIKHDNGYVTAYAHAESLNVSQGDRVDRGDVIGFAGATGEVAKPQLHFEVRQGVKPVDPRPLLLSSRDS
jgi:murein DD-endopeptidase MepM/ murein hydrolase activator NlpD